MKAGRPHPHKGKPYGPRKPDSELRTRYRKVLGKQAHRVLVEQRIGMTLPATAVVHHVDPNDKLTNRGQFVVCQDQEYHSLIEARTRAYNACGHAGWKKCRFCGQWDDPKNMLEKEWRARGKMQKRWDHYQFRYKCVSPAEHEAKKGQNYLHFARTEGIWQKVSEQGVRCILCGFHTDCNAMGRATHAKMHVRRGEAFGRQEPSLNNAKAKLKVRTVYHPVDKQIGTTQLSEFVHRSEP